MQTLDRMSQQIELMNTRNGSWRCAEHANERRRMIRVVTKILQSGQTKREQSCDETTESRSNKKKENTYRVAKKIELLLYLSAPSLQSYMNKTTLMERLRDIHRNLSSICSTDRKCRILFKRSNREI